MLQPQRASPQPFSEWRGGWLGTEVEVAGGEAYEAVPCRTGQLGDEEVVDSEPFLLK